MAYNTSNPPNKITMGVLAKVNTTEDTSVGGDLWYYKSADTIATVKAAGYFSDAAARGMQVGDVVLVYDRTTPALSVAFVLSISAAGASTLDATPLTAT